MKYIAYYPIYKSLTDSELFPEDRLEQDGLYATLKRVLRDNGYDIAVNSGEGVPKADIYIFNRLKDLFPLMYRMLKTRCMHRVIYQQWESALIDPMHTRRLMRHWQNIFGGILTWDDDLVKQGIPYVKSCYMVPRYDAGPRWNVPFEERKLVTNISGFKHAASVDGLMELYSWRERFIRFMESNQMDEFDLYGRGWDAKQFPSYRGEIDDKLEVLRQYRFSLCFENLTRNNGYVTEKILDCIGAGTIPVYWGADNITDYIPKECFIDYRDFNDFDRLYRYMRDMPEEVFTAYLKAQQDYLQSEAFLKRFTYNAYAEDVLAAIRKTEQNTHYSYPAAWRHFAVVYREVQVPKKWMALRSRIGNWYRRKICHTTGIPLENKEVQNERRQQESEP